MHPLIITKNNKKFQKNIYKKKISVIIKKY